MIEYSCEVSLSLDKAVKELDRIGARYTVTHETVLSFRERPTLAVKKVLTRCGFHRVPVDRAAASVGQVEALKEHFNT